LDSWANLGLLLLRAQVPARHWEIFDRGNLLGGCVTDYYPMERPATVPQQLQTQYVLPTLSTGLHGKASSAVSDGSFIVPVGLTHLFLIVNVIAMTTSSILVIARKYSEYAVAGLIGVVVTQALGYGLIFDLNFFLRNLSVMGGLLMVLSDSWVRKRFAPAGLPQLDEKDRKMYIQLAGRVLLIFLFVGFVFSGEWGFWRVLVSLVGLVACIMVVVGFKAKWSAVMLVLILSIFNLVVNNFWMVSSLFFTPQRYPRTWYLIKSYSQLHTDHPHKDFAKYDFFQILSIV
jgi:uncharacterized membrane protein YphA (DoxX/SURF4 family)